ncbi:exodeoxyribonuclease VII large subunit [Stenoxybacter acetivorans]|uniref:exodeoxyribonuclease VII large subunit n=1 Tax=Stenoxybacter acetivorans TaxID=422441 RepID=UPI0005651325|nr:exodeoxyribonuclease VII large subunit [Stenoxybacter acetivorans]
MSDFFAPAALSVSELNALAKQLLEDNLFGLWVTGEVSNFTRAASGHYYFSLKDNQAQVRCVLFKGIAAQLTSPLKEGDHIEVCGKISLYEARGEFQITVNAVRQKGLGQLYEAYERLKQQLQTKGLFAPEKKRRLPEYPAAVGIVTSLAAAALRDVISTLRRRHSGLQVIVYPTAVQGAGSEHQIAKAIQTASARSEVDVLIVCRGGGSIEDLWAFNEEAVVRAVAECRIPTISGVGHETDFTLTDFAADVRAPTPTAAAELVSPDAARLRQKINQQQHVLKQSLHQRYANASQKLDWLTQQLRHPRQNQILQQQKLTQCSQQLQHGFYQKCRQYRQNLTLALSALQYTRPNLTYFREHLQHQCQQLNQFRVQYFQAADNRLQQQQTLLNAVSPQTILARGYSVVSDARGRIIHDANQLRFGQTLRVRFEHGEVGVQVNTHAAQSDLFE